MRKVVSIVVASMALFFLSVTSSIAEWTAGISVSHGLYEASGSETMGVNGRKTSGNDMNSFTWILH